MSLVLAVALAMLFQTFETKAAWGGFDTSFAIQPDGKMVVAGVINDYLMIARLLPNKREAKSKENKLLKNIE